MHKLLSSRSRENRYGYFFILPALLYMILLIGYPLIYNFNLSLKNLDVMTFRGDSSIYIGLENYKTLLADSVFIQSLRQTFVFTAWCLVFQFTCGFILALFFSRKFPLAGLIRGTILIGYMMPMSVTALVFKNMFATGANEGVINYLLSLFGIVNSASPIGWLIGQKEALWAVIIANCWVGIPFNMLLLTGGLSGIPEDIYEAATIDGANSFRRFIHITLPLLKPAILSVLMLGFIYTFKVFDLIFVMTKGGPLNATQVLSTYSYRLSFTEYKFSMGAAGAVILFLCLMVVGLFYLWLVRNEESN